MLFNALSQPYSSNAMRSLKNKIKSIWDVINFCTHTRQSQDNLYSYILDVVLKCFDVAKRCFNECMSQTAENNEMGLLITRTST